MRVGVRSSPRSKVETRVLSRDDNRVKVLQLEVVFEGVESAERADRLALRSARPRSSGLLGVGTETLFAPDIIDCSFVAANVWL
jgi:hypothetical protein